MFPLKPRNSLTLFVMMIVILLMGCAPAVETAPEMEAMQAAAPTLTPELAPTQEPTTTQPVVEPSSFDDPFVYCAAVGTLDEPDERYVGDELPNGVIEGMIAEGIIAEDMPPFFRYILLLARNMGE